VSATRQPRIIILCDFMAVILILNVMFRSESKPPDARTPIITVLQCKTLPSHDPLFEKEVSYELPNRISRRLNGRELFLVCTDRGSRQANLRADRNQEDRVETRILSLN
jgi:hypothetical protein